ncbi:hypothetical protein FISHEDRAFT_75305 [Fistulina hepatica ATCC 64428]|uniref:Uncharacterized protein n=1 Tax=Fistulina hepatica ATCC 64428 TaxID=1128425 RepID=A0A0D7A8Q5_9AGAR|nr:hypothetical protein FISHEDRAFT_75305 [Fistulina hepatica ATCC 64428]
MPHSVWGGTTLSMNVKQKPPASPLRAVDRTTPLMGVWQRVHRWQRLLHTSPTPSHLIVQQRLSDLQPELATDGSDTCESHQHHGDTARKMIEGYEIQFGTKHIGHALLTKLFLPTLLETAKQPSTGIRVISVSSKLQILTLYPIMYDQDELNNRFAILHHALSKLANIRYAPELVACYPQITSVSVYSGMVSTYL